MELVYVLVLALAASTATAQVCDDTSVVFILDQSENALRASSTNPETAPFDILRGALEDFMDHPQVVAATNFRVGIYGYSSDSVPPVEFVPLDSTKNVVRSNLNKIGQEITLSTAGGSWTYNGFKLITKGPRFPNRNRMVVISSQGSGTSSRQAKTQTEVDRMLSLGWDVSLIAVQGINPIAEDDLKIVSQGADLNILVDPNPEIIDGNPNPQGYKELSKELKAFIENNVCAGGATQRPTTTTTTTTTPGTGGNNPSPPGPATQGPTPVEPPRFNGTCSGCLFEGGYGFDFDTEYCDTFYLCMPDTAPIKKQCPSGTFWDGAQCNYINKVRCPEAICNAETPEGTKYPSGRCCNKYYLCRNSELFEIACEAGMTFNADSSECETPANKTLECQATGRFECDVSTTGPVNSTDCNGYAPDPFGDPCKFQFAGWSLRVAPGTVWSQEICSLDFTDTDLCMTSQVANDTYFLGSAPADECNAIFLADFNDGSKDVYSERLDMKLSVYTIQQEAELTDNALTFTTEMTDPFLYYYFFNNREVAVNSAFRVRFRLNNAENGKVYDILSNNYCSLCPETISFTVTPTSNTGRAVSAVFLTNMGNTVALDASINKPNANLWLELIVIFGDDAVYGQINAIAPNGDVRQSVDFEPKPKIAGATGMINRCGIQLGRGPNNNFVGSIDDFAVYEYCTDINSVLR